MLNAKLIEPPLEPLDSFVVVDAVDVLDDVVVGAGPCWGGGDPDGGGPGGGGDPGGGKGLLDTVTVGPNRSVVTVVVTVPVGVVEVDDVVVESTIGAGASFANASI
jgi:hypothetical protein